MTTTNLTPGPELDAAVAKACGVEGGLANRADGGMFIPSPPCLLQCGELGEWRPSTDLNAAFEAAEKCGLSGDPNLTLCKTSHGGWMIAKDVHDGDRWVSRADLIAMEPTPALAICAAILSLKEIS